MEKKEKKMESQADWQGADVDQFEQRKEEWREKFGKEEEKEEDRLERVENMIREVLYKLDSGDYVSGTRVSED
jgi:hypothetical protein